MRVSPCIFWIELESKGKHTLKTQRTDIMKNKVNVEAATGVMWPQAKEEGCHHRQGTDSSLELLEK